MADSGKRVVVDPITRIEGHLRIEAKTNDEGVIEQAYSSGTMVRGIEIILRGRDPRDAWAFAQRICGVCTLVHGIASVRSVEDALDYEIPKNAQLIRNLMIAGQNVHDHVMHFYHLHALDWVDVVSALKADPKKTSELAQSLSSFAKSSPGYYNDMKKKLAGFVETGQLGIFAKAYWGHPEYKLPPEANLMAVCHYLEALSWQRDVAKILTIFGGKNPHPHFLVGGVPCAIDLDSDSAINMKKLAEIKNIIANMRYFVEQAYIPDLLAVASFYKDWFKRGEGLGNFLCYGDFPSKTMRDPDSFAVPRGVILGKDLSKVIPLDLDDPSQIQEFVGHSWYEYEGGDEKGLHPYDGETKLEYSGPKPPYDYLEVEKKYSWLKSPRWKETPVEVGPLARVLMLYASKDPMTVEVVNSTLSKLELPAEALFSTLGRTAARGLESILMVSFLEKWYDELVANIKAGDTKTFNEEKWEPKSWPAKAQGVGFMEAPRGALGHWIVIENERIANYQAVVPSTWNAGPRDHKGQAGAYEAALQDRHTLVNKEQPLEILRTIHSFDPCIACAVHVTDDQGDELVEVKIC